MAKRKNRTDDKISLWIARAVLIAGLVVGVLMNTVWASSWPISPRWSGLTDSSRLNFYKGATLAYTSKRTTQQSFDTTLTVYTDTIYTAEVRVYYAGLDSGASWIGKYGWGAGNGNVQVPIHWPDNTDSVRWILKRDAAQIATGVRTGAQSFDTALSIIADKLYNLETKIYYAGIDSASSFTWQHDSKSPSSVLDVLDTVSYRCLVYGNLSTILGSAAAYAECTFTLAKTVNNTCNSSIVAGFSTKVRANALGAFSIRLSYSACLGTDTTDYFISVKTRDGRTVPPHAFTVPSASTYQLIW